MKKKSISSQIIMGYAITGISVLALIIFAIWSGLSTKSNLNKINDFSKMNDFIIDSLMSYSNARPNARAMILSNDYDDSIVNTAITELDLTLSLLDDFRIEAVEHNLTDLVKYIDNMRTGIADYKKSIELIDPNNKAQLVAHSAWSAQAAVLVDSLNNINEQLKINIESRILTMAPQEVSRAFNNQGIVENALTQFTSTRIQSMRLLFSSDTSAYQPMLDSMDDIVRKLAAVESELPTAIATLVRAMPNEIEKYKSCGTDFYNLIIEQARIFEDFNTETVTLQQAIKDLNNETTRVIDDVFKTSTTQQNIVLVILIIVSLALVLFVSTYVVIMIKSVSASLKSAAESLHSATESIGSAAGQLNSAAASLADSGSRQAASIEETSATMNETASMVQQNTENTRRATDITNEAGVIAMEAVRLAEELIGGMNELSKSSNEIQKVISTITDISFKTNILALNASVESVRAGEAGKSFAVVAGEVRNLSMQSSQATTDTSSIINSNIQLTRQNVENSKMVSQTLDRICEHAKKSSQLLDEISHASEEQSKGVQQINISLSQMEKVTQSNAAISQESASAATELKNQADNLLLIYKVIDELVYGSRQ